MIAEHKNFICAIIIFINLCTHITLENKIL